MKSLLWLVCMSWMFVHVKVLGIADMQSIEIGALLSSMTTEESLETAARAIVAVSQNEQFLDAYAKLCIQKVELIATTLKKNLALQEREEFAAIVRDFSAWYMKFLEMALDADCCATQEGEAEYREHQEKLYEFLTKPLVASLLYYALLTCAEAQENASCDFVQKVNHIVLEGTNIFIKNLL